MQFTYQMHVLQKLYGLNWGETEAIRQYWRVFYEDPEKYKETELEKMVLDWVKNGEGKQEAIEWNESTREW